jgi:hypothetical protein
MLGATETIEGDHNTFGRSGHTRSQRSCNRESRLGQSPLSRSFHFIRLPCGRISRSAYGRDSGPCARTFAVDASLIVADANKQRSIPGSEWQKTRDPETASRAVKEYLATLDGGAFGAGSAVPPPSNYF